MSEQVGPITPQDLDDLLGPEDAELAPLIQEMMEQTAAESAAKKRKDTAKAQIIALMDRDAMTAVTCAGRKLSFRTQTYYGLNAQDPEMRERAKQWMEEVAPTINLPATDKVKKAVELWQDDHPGQELPDFIKVTEKRSLGNRKA